MKVYTKILLLISLTWNVLSISHNNELKDRQNILLFENINLRGYKDAFLEHIDKCDSIGKFYMDSKGLSK